MRCGCPSMASVGAYRKIIQMETIIPMSESVPSTSEAIGRFVPCCPVVTAASCCSIVVGRFANAIINILLMNFDNRIGNGSAPASGRDKGWDGVDAGALCLSSLGGRHLARHPEHPHESWCEQDKHKAPAHPRIRPLSLQVRRRFPPVPYSVDNIHYLVPTSYSSITYSNVSMDTLRKMISKAAIRPSHGGSFAVGTIKVPVARTALMTTGTIKGNTSTGNNNSRAWVAAAMAEKSVPMAAMPSVPSRTMA